MHARKQDEGFTLIELLIVIVILGILAGIVVFAVGSARDDSVGASCKADVKTVSTAAEAYKAKNGSYAADIPALVSASFLKSSPSSSDYTIGYTVTSGALSVTGTKSAANGGGTC